MLRAVPPIMPRTVPAAAGGFLALGLARRVAGPDLDAQAVHEVLRGLPHNVTTDMDLELWASATRLDQASTAALHAAPPAELAERFHDRALPPVLQRGLAAFLAEHGHRTAAEIDLGMPRWSDDPTQVLGSLANYLRITDPTDHPDARFARGAAAAEAAVAQVVGEVRRRSRVRAWVTGLALRRTRQLAGMRETHKDYLVRVLAHARAQLAILGAELAGRGLLVAADDVFFLELREVAAALDGTDQRGLVADRRAEYDRELRRRHIPRVLLSDGTEPEAEHAAPAPEGALVGTPASAGTVTGVVRVVLDPADAHLEPGEILVAPSTDPGWTPLFLTAGALVMEMGGSNSHGAVVAREYGIPAVVGVPDATGRLRTGQTVTVDGAAGTVVSGPGIAAG
jgi:pyruvate,water dikinase